MPAKISPFTQVSLALSLLLSLSGCWTSERSLIQPDASVNPLEMGIYKYYAAEGDAEPHDIHLIPFPGGGYIYLHVEEAEATPLLVHRIDDDWHILQFGNDAGNVYGISRRVGDRIEVYDPDCEEYLGVIDGLDTGGTYCRFSTLADLVEATQVAIPHIEAGEGGSLNGWFEPFDVQPIDQ